MVKRSISVTEPRLHLGVVGGARERRDIGDAASKRATLAALAFRKAATAHLPNPFAASRPEL
eukprot:6631299-Prymnesium_polylepis.1